MGSRSRVAQSTFRAFPGLRLGRRSSARAHRARLVSQRIRRSEKSGPIRGRMLVQSFDGVGTMARTRADFASQLVARGLHRSLRALGPKTRSANPQLLNDLPNRARRLKKSFGVSIATY